MHSLFFPIYSEKVLNDMAYSIMARCHVFVPDSTDAREFLYYAECVERDIREENKRHDMMAGRSNTMKAASRQRR